jgi:hypothetical protein
VVFFASGSDSAWSFFRKINLDRGADSTTAPRYLQSQKLGPELGVKGRRVRESASVGRFGPPTVGRALVRRRAVLRRPRDATDLAKKVRTEACEDWAARSDQSTRISGSVPLTCHYGRHRRAAQAARDHETRKDPSTNPMSSNISQADSAGSIPVTRSKRGNRCSTSESGCISHAGQRSFASEKALVPLRVPLAISASAPGDCQFPS